MASSLSRSIISDLGAIANFRRDPITTLSDRVSNSTQVTRTRSVADPGVRGGKDEPSRAVTDGYDDGYKPSASQTRIRDEGIKAVADLRTAYINKVIADTRSRAAKPSDDGQVEAAAQLASGALGRSGAYSSSNGVASVTVISGRGGIAAARASASAIFAAVNAVNTNTAVTPDQASESSPESAADSEASVETSQGAAAGNEAGAASSQPAEGEAAGTDPVNGDASADAEAETTPETGEGSAGEVPTSESDAATEPDAAIGDEGTEPEANASSGATSGSSTASGTNSTSSGTSSSSSGGLLTTLFGRN